MTGSIDGYTFKSSSIGQRRARTGMWLIFLVFPGFFYVKGVPDSLDGWLGLAAMVIGACAGWLLAYLAIDDSYLWASVKIDGTHAHLVKKRCDWRVPVDSIQRIRVERSNSGRRRLLTLWDADNEPYRLFDPTNGEALESWAITEARALGIPVEVRRSWHMDYQFQISLVAIGVGVAIGLLAVMWLVGLLQ